MLPLFVLCNMFEGKQQCIIPAALRAQNFRIGQRMSEIKSFWVAVLKIRLSPSRTYISLSAALRAQNFRIGQRMSETKSFCQAFFKKRP